MIRTNTISSLSDVPQTWAFEYYCNLNEKLTGQDVRIKSLFNLNDKVPSFYVFRKGSKYYFKDFSTGYGGNHVKLVELLYNLDAGKAINQIIHDYNAYVTVNNYTHVKPEFKKYSRYKVHSYKIRNWSNEDKKYWLSFNIGATMLEKYNVKPISLLVLSKELDNGTPYLINFNGPNIYGFFTKDNVLYKIYTPKNPTHKFIKVITHLQGYDQLEKHKYLLICSSLKDIMAVKSLNIKIDCIAPDAENILISEEYIYKFKSEYENIIVLFDNDAPGKRAAKRYLDKYAIKNINLSLSKDVSDSIKDNGKDLVRSMLYDTLKKCINQHATT